MSAHWEKRGNSLFANFNSSHSTKLTRGQFTMINANSSSRCNYPRQWIISIKNNTYIYTFDFNMNLSHQVRFFFSECTFYNSMVSTNNKSECLLCVSVEHSAEFVWQPPKQDRIHSTLHRLYGSYKNRMWEELVLCFHNRLQEEGEGGGAEEKTTTKKHNPHSLLS